MLRSTNSTQEDEGDFESVFDVDYIKYQMVTELVQVRSHTGYEDVQELGVLWIRLCGEEGGCSICYFVSRFSRNCCGHLATMAKVVKQTLSFKGKHTYKRENVMIVNVWKNVYKSIFIFKRYYVQDVPWNLEP